MIYMDLRHLLYFKTVAETLHFGKAAEKLNIVQPALSMQIKALEEELDAKLLTRTKRKVELTQVGRLFLAEAERTLRDAERAKEIVRAAKRGAIGRVRVGFSAGAVYAGVLADLIRAVREAAPDLILDLHECHPNQAFELLQREQIDIAFGTLYSLDGNTSFETIELVSYPPYLALPHDHRLADEDAIDRATLKDEAFIGYAGPGDLDGLGLTSKVLGFTPRTSCRVSTPAMAFGVAASGLGLAIVPSSLAVPTSGVVFRPLKDCNERIDVTLIWRMGESDSATLGFLDSVKARLAE